MNPAKADHARLVHLTDLPNIGPAMAADLRRLGIEQPAQLAGQCAFEMYERLCRESGRRHDPCVIDVFLSAVAFVAGEPAKPWWAFTAARKACPAGRR